MSLLPLLVSVPHAGLDIPEEARSFCVLKANDIRRDSDEGAREVYQPLKGYVSGFVTTSCARAFVDLNRPCDDFSKDGVVKSHTCWEIPVWSSPLPESLVEKLLDSYYFPYHHKISEYSKSPRIIMGIDCHTMAETGPPISPDPYSPRPLINLGDLNHTSCPPEWSQLMVECFKEQFGHDVILNQPFNGGWITRHHCREMPWIQLEISRAPFLPDRKKGRKVLAALQRWVKKVDSG